MVFYGFCNKHPIDKIYPWKNVLDYPSQTLKSSIFTPHFSIKNSSTLAAYLRHFPKPRSSQHLIRCMVLYVAIGSKALWLRALRRFFNRFRATTTPSKVTINFISYGACKKRDRQSLFELCIGVTDWRHVGLSTARNHQI